MNIRDLPIELQQLVHKRQIEQGNNGTFDGDIYEGRHSGNFYWDDTPERELFWSDIAKGRDTTDSSYYPKKFSPEIY